MKKTVSALVSALLLASPLISFAHSDAPASAAPAPYSVFVDLPTGYTFVKMPTGWKFVGAVSQEEARHVPSTVLTSVLPSVQTASTK